MAAAPAVCSTSLKGFLQASKTAVGGMLASPHPHKKMLLVMGNEASDCDSIVCAVVAAYGISQSLIAGVGAYDVVVPVINIPRDDLDLRQDAVLLLKEARVDPADLVFFPELSEGGVRALVERKALGLMLVDHNKLGVAQEWLAPAVVGVLDHHDDTGSYSEAAPRVVEDSVGSCSSIVAQALHGDGLDTPRTFTQRFGEDVSVLLGGALVLDTRLFKGKCAPLDARVGAALGYTVDGVPNGEATYFYDRLLHARTDVRGLTSPQKLRKDYKVWGKGAKAYGIATVPASLKEWGEDDEGFADCVVRTAAGEGLGLYLVMLTFEEEGVFRRQILVHATDKKVLDECCTHLMGGDHPAVLQASGKGSLELERIELWGGGGGGLVVAFEQRNLKASRKQVQPVVESFVAAR